MTENTTECAVCGDTVEVQRHTPKKLQGGVIYHFCSEDCREEFVRNPSQHTGGRTRPSMP